MAEMEKTDVEKIKGGENVENEAKEVWYPLELEVSLGKEQETALARNGIDYKRHPQVVKNEYDRYHVEYTVPIYPDELDRYKDYIYVEKGQVKVKEKWGINRVYYAYDNDDTNLVFWDENKEEYKKLPREDSVDCKIPPKYNYLSFRFDKGDIETAISLEIAKQGKILATEEARAITLEVLKQIKDYKDNWQENAKECKEKIRAEFEERRKKREEERKKAEQEKKEKEEKERKIREALLSKDWVKQLKEKMDISDKRQKEIERFKNKYGLIDEELQISETSEKPYVHITAKIDLRPIGIDRTLYIRNYLPDQFANVDEVGKEVFSDYSQEVASKLAEILDHEIVVFDDSEDDEYKYNAYLVVVDKGNHDNIEVASTEIEDDC